jgi:hypothetical protein
MNPARLMKTSLFALTLGLAVYGCSSDNGSSTFNGGLSGPTAGNGGATGFVSGGGGGSAANAGSGGGGGSAANAGSGGGGGTAGADGSAGTAGSGGGGGGVVYIGDAGDESCGATRAGAEARQVNILLVIDKSGSMADTPTGFASDKWTAMKSALGAALDPVKGAISFGLELYPYNPVTPIQLKCSPNCCEMQTQATAINIPVESGMVALPNILSTVGSQSPGGGTPTAAALKEALWYFTAGAGAGLQGDKYVLLATDGAPNCNAGLTCDAAHCTANLDALGSTNPPACTLNGGNCCAPIGGGASCLDDSSSVSQITALKTAGVSTFVIGIPGSENYATVLDSFAVAGGQPASATSPQYYAVSASGGVAALTEAFKSITIKLVTTCDMQLKVEPPDPTLLNITIDDALLGKAGGEAGIDGWTLDTSTKPSTIRITGAPCDKLKSKGATSVQVLYGCPYIPIN